MPFDADTILPKESAGALLSVLEEDKKKSIACVSGKVVGETYSWVTFYREWEYDIAHRVHKTAQNIENAIIVCPGCATVYRSEIFKLFKVPTGTVTEDMDFTFLLHRKNLGRIVYTNKATVITQDPILLSDFIKQIKRWYTGFWQCVQKHNIPWGGQRLDAEVTLLATEGLLNGLLILLFIFILPLSLFHPYLLLIPLGIDLFFFMLPTLFVIAKRHQTWSLFLYIPHFYLLRALSSFIFLASFIKVFLGLDFQLPWGKATRYKIRSTTI